MRLRVRCGSRSTPGGKSHSCVTPTRSPPRPRAQTSSVREGSRLTIRIGLGRISHSGKRVETGRARPGKASGRTSSPGRRTTLDGRCPAGRGRGGPRGSSARDVDDPVVGEPGLGVEPGLRVAVVREAASGHLDDQQDVRGLRPAVADSSPGGAMSNPGSGGCRGPGCRRSSGPESGPRRRGMRGSSRRQGCGECLRGVGWERASRPDLPLDQFDPRGSSGRSRRDGSSRRTART